MTKKCKTKDCKKKIDPKFLYCSYECASYDNKFSVIWGWREYDPNDKKYNDHKRTK